MRLRKTPIVVLTVALVAVVDHTITEPIEGLPSGLEPIKSNICGHSPAGAPAAAAGLRDGSVAAASSES